MLWTDGTSIVVEFCCDLTSNKVSDILLLVIIFFCKYRGIFLIKEFSYVLYFLYRLFGVGNKKKENISYILLLQSCFSACSAIQVQQNFHFMCSTSFMSIGFRFCLWFSCIDCSLVKYFFTDNVALKFMKLATEKIFQAKKYALITKKM